MGGQGNLHGLPSVPAGEKSLPVATVTSDGFLSVGGAGIGGVFGAKNLKGIAVKGQHSVRVATATGWFRWSTHWQTK